MISVVILTKNSSKQLSKTLASLSFCDELIIVDDYSSDSTIKIARKYKARIFKRELNNNFSAQRNFGLSKARYEWVLFIDSDEIVTKSLAKEIKRQIEYGKYNGFYIKRRDIWLGKKIRHGETNINILRLGRRNTGKWKRAVHETWEIKGEIGKLKNIIVHYPHETLSEFISEVAKYSQLHSIQNKKEKKKPYSFKALIFPVIKFKVNFFVKRGFMDGLHGFVIAGIMSFHSFLSWSNLWLNSRKK